MDTMRAALSQACYYPDRAMRAARAGLALYLGADENCVLPTAGGAAAIDLTLGVRRGAVHVQPPTFGEYAERAKAHGRRMAANQAIQADDTVVICNPNNPTGYLYSEEELQRLRDIVLSHDLYLFADEVYREFRYTDAPYLSALCLEGLEQNVVVIDSVSKRYSECGTRIGMIVSHNKEAMAAILKFCQARLSPPLLGQIVAEASIEGTEEYSKECFDEYLARRDFFIAGLNKIPGVYSPMPNGAFYTIASLPVENAEDFCAWCLTDFSYKDDGTPEGYTGETVMMAPAAGFYSTPGLGRNQVRLAYVLKKEDLARALLVLEKALEAYRLK